MALCYQTLHQGLGSLWNLCRPTLGWRSSWQKQAEDENNEHWPWKLAKSAPLAWTSEALGLTLYSFSLDGGFTRRHSLWILWGQGEAKLLQRPKTQSQSQSERKTWSTLPLPSCGTKSVRARKTQAAAVDSRPRRPMASRLRGDGSVVLLG